MGTFITNSKERSLKKRLTTLISKTEELFFYFSDIREKRRKKKFRTALEKVNKNIAGPSRN